MYIIITTTIFLIYVYFSIKRVKNKLKHVVENSDSKIKEKLNIKKQKMNPFDNDEIFDAIVLNTKENAKSYYK